jgi:glycosyltransferase involved in cell wall biosynthesis
MNVPRRRFSVVTPTLNRAHLLPRLYKSLAEQTLTDIEWIVVDGGSKDGTSELMAQWSASGPVSVRFICKDGAPKHTAVNIGIAEAAGEFVQIMDSDDVYVPTAFERFLHHWSTIPASEQSAFVGVCGLVAGFDGAIIGRKFPKDILDSDDFELQTRYRIIGDEKISVLRTDVLREFLFPENLDRFVTEQLIWNRIGLRYRTRFVNEVFVLKEYQADGLTSGVQLLGPNNPRASALTELEFARADRPIPFDLKVKAYAHYIQYSMHAGESSFKCVRDLPSPGLAAFCLPLAWSLFLRALWRQARARRSANVEG